MIPVSGILNRIHQIGASMCFAKYRSIGSSKIKQAIKANERYVAPTE